jgi:S-adenosylmethionine decarboxylase
MVPAGGKHLLVDFCGCPSNRLNNPIEIEDLLKGAALHCGATVIFSHMHHFGDEYGVTGVIILAESHLSLHSWPEVGYCAIDAFMCGNCNPEDMMDILLNYFQPKTSKIKLEIRG